LRLRVDVRVSAVGLEVDGTAGVSAPKGLAHRDYSRIRDRRTTLPTATPASVGRQRIRGRWRRKGRVIDPLHRTAVHDQYRRGSRRNGQDGRPEDGHENCQWSDSHLHAILATNA